MLSELSPQLIGSGSERALSLGSHHRGLSNSSDEKDKPAEKQGMPRCVRARVGSRRTTNCERRERKTRRENFKPSLSRSWQSPSPGYPVARG